MVGLNDGDKEERLCHAGQLLEIRMLASTKSLSCAAASLEISSAKITELIAELTKYAIRDNERLDNLEESKKCKNKKIKEIEDKAHEMKESFAGHCGEHKAERRLTVASGVGGATGLVAAWEFVKYLVKTQH